MRALIFLAACSHPALPFDEIEIKTAPGVSDITLDGAGRIYVMPERDREIDEVTLAGAVTRHGLDGITPGDDTEGLTWLDGDHFAIGTEGGHAPTAAIVWVDRVGDRFMARRARSLSSAELGVELTVNRGAEGVCGRGADVLAAIESVGHLPGGARYAPIAWLRGDELAVTKLRLTSDKGKISAISCTIDGDVAHAIAIERHYAVSKILSFDLRRGDGEVTPKVEYDIGSLLNNRLNLEGIARLPDGRLVAVNDNQGSSVSGPSELIVFHSR